VSGTERLVSVDDAASGKRLWASIRSAGRDVVVVVGGGERPHVGCVVVASPMPSRTDPGTCSASCSVLTIPPHKEEPIARSVASRLAASTGRVAVVTAGVHEDDLDRAGIEAYLRLGDRLAEAAVAALEDDRFTEYNREE
jgi:hypothetical protein